MQVEELKKKVGGLGAVESTSRHPVYVSVGVRLALTFARA